MSQEPAIGKIYDKQIDPSKTTLHPGTLQFPHHVGSALIKPEDQGKIKSRALTAMRLQTDKQMQQLFKQAQLLVEQANEIKKRVEVSERVYGAEMGFEPLVSHTYYLYEKPNGLDTVSMIAPDQWGKTKKYPKCIAQITLLADHTWDVISTEPES